MTIGRIAGPMLFSNLERQGLDLSIEGNLIYFDVNRKRIGINTDAPEFDFHIDTSNGDSPVLFVNGNIISNTISVKDAFTLPTDSGSTGQVLASDGAQGTYWADGSSTTIDRKKFSYEIPDLAPNSTHEFVIEIGIASIVYALTVSRPVQVEVFATPTKDEPNPYTFLATLGHLVDDGTVLLSDGSIIQQRQYSIFANQEEPPQPKVYATITEIDGVAGPLTLEMTYFSAVTDNSSKSYNINVVDTLPTVGVEGQSVILKSSSKIYVWYDSQWNATT